MLNKHLKMHVEGGFNSLILIYLYYIPVISTASNIVCGHRWSCEKYTMSENQEASYFDTMNCHCDKNCIFLKDCCHDAIPRVYDFSLVLDSKSNNFSLTLDSKPTNLDPEIDSKHKYMKLDSNTSNLFQELDLKPSNSSMQWNRKPGNLSLNSDSISLESISCMHIKEISVTNNVYIVNKCPSMWPDQKVRSQCEDTNENEVLLRLPVTGIESGLMFKNLYCAVCHQVTYIYWAPSVFCTSILPMLDTMTIQDIFHYSGCYVRFSPPNNETQFRPCLKDVISTCHSEYNDTDVIEACENTHEMQIVYSKNKTWRNVHCATCNFETDLFCVPDNDAVLSDKLYSFSVLLNLNTGTGSTRYGTKNVSMAKNGTAEYACKYGEVYDPYISQCRSVVCDDSMVYEDGRCQERNITDCSRIVLNETEYAIVNNSTLLQLSSGKLYDETEYYLKGSLAFVCTNLTRNYTQTTQVDEYIIVVTLSQEEGIISVIGLSVSLLALLVTIVIQTTLIPLQNTPGKNLVSLCCSLFVAESLMVAAPFAESIQVLCKGVAIFMHYFFLAAFFWMNVIAADVWVVFSKSFVPTGAEGKSPRFYFYSIYAWGVPALIMAASLLVNYLPLDSSFKPDYGKGLCWIVNKNSLLLFFATPLLLIIFMNTLFFVIATRNICLKRMSARKYLQNKDDMNVSIFIRLFVVIGLTWVVGFLATLISQPILWYLFAVLNTLQGFFISISFVTTKKVLRLLRERLLGSRIYAKHSSNQLSLMSKESTEESVSTIAHTV